MTPSTVTLIWNVSSAYHGDRGMRQRGHQLRSGGVLALRVGRLDADDARELLDKHGGPPFLQLVEMLADLHRALGELLRGHLLLSRQLLQMRRRRVLRGLCVHSPLMKNGN